MPIALARLIRGMIRAGTWVPAAIVIVIVFATSWPLMALAEPAGAEVVAPENYWWWFVITAATVGYGDLYPTTLGGHVVGAYVVVGGIATLTTLFASLAAALDKGRQASMSGQLTLNVADHLVLLGYTPERTERIIDELVAEGDRPVVLCAPGSVPANPLGDRPVDFIRGDLTSADVAARSCLARAHSVLVDVADDNEALAVVVALDQVAPGVQVVVALRDLRRDTHLRHVNPAVRCVQWHSPRMVTEELQNPGVSRVFADLMTGGGANTYSLRLPSGPTTFGQCQTALGQHFDATVLAADTGEQLLVSPAWSTALPAGAVLYYVSEQRLSSDHVARVLDAR